MTDREHLLEIERRVLDGEHVPKDEMLPVLKELFEQRDQVEGARRILARWARVEALLTYIQKTNPGWLADHIQHVLLGIGGQP